MPKPQTKAPQIEKAQLILSVLKQSVENALEKKRKLGQYAVIEQDGKIIKLFTK